MPILVFTKILKFIKLFIFLKPVNFYKLKTSLFQISLFPNFRQIEKKKKVRE